jgi:hypothetical protein
MGFSERKRAAVYKLIPKIKYITKCNCTSWRSSEVVCDWSNSLSRDLVTDHIFHRPWSIRKYTFLLCKCDTKLWLSSQLRVSWLWSPFCSSEDNKPVGSPLALPLPVMVIMMMMMMLYTLTFFYHNCFVFLQYLVKSVCCFPMLQPLLLQEVYHTLCWVLPWSRCTVCRVSGHQQIARISVTS